MTTLMERMRQELVRRNYAPTTIQSYIKAVEQFQQHISAPLEDLGPDDIRSYHAYLLGERKLAAPSRRYLQATTNPLERISISDPAQLERSRRKQKPSTLLCT